MLTRYVSCSLCAAPYDHSFLRKSLGFFKLLLLKEAVSYIQSVGTKAIIATQLTL